MQRMQMMQFVPAPMPFYPPPNPQQQLFELGNAVMSDENRILVLEQRADQMASKLDGIQAQLNRTSQLQTLAENDTNELQQLRKDSETRKAWTKSLEIELEVTKTELRTIRERLNTATAEKEKSERFASSKIKALAKQNAEVAALRSIIGELETKLRNVEVEQQKPAKEQSGWRPKQQQQQRIKSDAKFGSGANYEDDDDLMSEWTRPKFEAAVRKAN